MPISRDTVVRFTRYNSGKHMLDSGDAYGRVYERKAPVGLFDVDARDGEVRITLTGLLMQRATLMRGIQQALDHKFRASDLNVFEVGEAVMEARGYKQVARDNTYNAETDLDQCFIWEVYQYEDSASREWYYDTDAIVLINAHTGCDVRGGYSPPIAVQFDSAWHGDAVLPDFTVDYRPVGETTERWLSDNGINEDMFTSGYSSAPGHRLREAVGEFVRVEKRKQVLYFRRPDGKRNAPLLAFGYDFNG